MLINIKYFNHYCPYICAYSRVCFTYIYIMGVFIKAYVVMEAIEAPLISVPSTAIVIQRVMRPQENVYQREPATP